jgi:tetratricopeptide (TPR) repeat protein
MYQDDGVETRTILGAQSGLAQLALSEKNTDLASDLFNNPRIPWSKHRVIDGIELLGRLATLIGDFDAAENHFEEALRRIRPPRYRPATAEVATAYSDMLIERGASGDAEKATELQDEAIAIVQDLGMKPLLERV